MPSFDDRKRKPWSPEFAEDSQNVPNELDALHDKNLPELEHEFKKIIGDRQTPVSQEQLRQVDAELEQQKTAVKESPQHKEELEAERISSERAEKEEAEQLREQEANKRDAAELAVDDQGGNAHAVDDFHTKAFTENHLPSATMESARAEQFAHDRPPSDRRDVGSVDPPKQQPEQEQDLTQEKQRSRG